KALPKSRDGMQTGAIMGRAVAANSDEAAVADAWLHYWQVRTKSFMDAKVDPAARDAVAIGLAAQEITQLTNNRRKLKKYTHGVINLNPTRIIINGNLAVLLDCAIDESRDVYSDGTIESIDLLPTGFRADLKQNQGSWYTENFVFEEKLCTNKGMEQG
ncbi:MAG: hypothetical protein QG608_2992, partial [Actinomycetota bacterium]|nr:hypothetical protein [Actinomycetota bacterium]